MTLPGLIMDKPLMIASIIRHAARYHTHTEVVSRNIDGSIHRSTYGRTYQRVCQLAHAIGRLGMRPGDRVGALGWNHYDQGVEVITPFFPSSGTGQINAVFPVSPMPAELSGVGAPSTPALAAARL